MEALAAAREVTSQALRHGDGGRPAESHLQLVVGVTRLLPVGVPAPPIEYGWQLSLRPVRVLLPGEAERVTHGVGHIDGRKASDVPLVQAQKAPARGQIVVDDVEDLAVDARGQSRAGDRLCAVVDIGQRDGIGAAQVEKEPEGVDADPARDGVLARAKYRARSDDDVRDPEAFSVLPHDLLLLELRETIRVPAQLGALFDRARLVEGPPPTVGSVRVHGERADKHEAPQTGVLLARLEQIACRHDGVHEGIREGLLAGARGEVIDDRHVLGRGRTILARQEVALEHVDARPLAAAAERFDARRVTRGPGKREQVATAAVEQAVDDTGSDETGRPGDEDPVVWSDDSGIDVRSLPDAQTPTGVSMPRSMPTSTQ